MNGIEINNFTLKIREKDEIRALYNNLNLTLRPGSIMMLVGASGSGKSTFLKLLTGLLTPLSPNIEISGSFRLFGQELMQLDYPKDMHREVGLVFQDFALFDDFSPRENILFSGEISGKYHSNVDIENQTDQLARQLQIEEPLKVSQVSDLSGGQKQRVAMCRLLIANPRLMIFDEPTSGLDPISAKKAAKLIMEQAQKDKIILIVTHDYHPFLLNPDRKVDFMGIMDGKGAFYLQQPADKTTKQIEAEVEKCLQSASPVVKTNQLPRNQYFKMVAMDFFCKIFRISKQVFALRSAFLPKLDQFKWHRNIGYKIFKFAIIDAIPFVLISGFILGMLSTYFSLSENFGDLQRYLDPILFAQALSTISKVGFVVICPLFTAIFIGTRSGAAVSGYLGNLVLTKQIDAYRIYGIKPENLFLNKIIWAFGIGFFFLAVLTFLGFTLASLIVVMLLKTQVSYQEWSVAFFQFLGSFPFYNGWFWFMVKTISAGIVTAFSSYVIGTLEKKNSQQLTSGITSCVIINILLVLIVFFLILMWERSI